MQNEEPWESTFEEPDFSSLSLNRQMLPARFVQSSITWQNDNPSFTHIIQEIASQPQPGIFLTPEEPGDIRVGVRWKLNRHAIRSSEVFRDKHGMVYRDVDVKGSGFVGGIPMGVLPVQLPRSESDMEIRGLLHQDVADNERLLYDDLSRIQGLRLGHVVAQVELYELINRNGELTPRGDFSSELYLNVERVKPSQITRVMGVASRVNTLPFSERNPSYIRFGKEVLDDAISLVELELGTRLSPQDYTAWFIDTLATQLAIFHKNDCSPDWRFQNHAGTHNVTLDCRCVDLSRCETPGSLARHAEKAEETYRKYPELRRPTPTKEEFDRNLRALEKEDLMRGEIIADRLARGVGAIYPNGQLKDDSEKRFNRVYAEKR